MNAHRRLLEIVLKVADDRLSVELPFSGHGPLTQAAVDLADMVVQQIGPHNSRFFCQANGWHPHGDWGAPSPEIEAAFDRVWQRPICRGQQAIQPEGFDWAKMYAILRTNQATYCEVYVRSFVLPGSEELRRQIREFAEYIQDQMCGDKQRAR